MERCDCGPCWNAILLLLFKPEDLSLNGYSPVVAGELEMHQNGGSNMNTKSKSTGNISGSVYGDTRNSEHTSSTNPIAGSSSTIKNGTGNIARAAPTAPMQTPVKNSIFSDMHASGLHLKYDLREEIGVGSTSTCYRCIRKSDQKEFACKVIDKREVEQKFTGLLDQFNIEMKILIMLNHPNIIKLHDSFETNECVFIILEMMKGGELFDYVVEKGTLSEEEASIIVRKITSAVAHMHSLNIIHRDLKPENLLLTSKGSEGSEVKLIDFGLAKVMNETVARSFLGTKGYLAPEMLQRNAYDKAVDIWALGVIVFVLLCGCLPFDDDSTRIATESAARKKFTLRFPRWATNLSASAKDLLHNLLDVNPKTRYTAEQAMSHPWVSGKSVQPNSYLQSPSLLGERRKKERESRSKLDKIQEVEVRARKNSI